MTTAEHRNLGSILDLIARLEQLRSRGLTLDQMAERIRLTHPERPGGGEWSAASVGRVLEIADTHRPPASPPRAGQLRQPPAPLPVEPRVHRQRPSLETDFLPKDHSARELEQRRRWPVVVGFLTLIGILGVGVGLYQTDFLDGRIEADGQAETIVGTSDDRGRDTGGAAGTAGTEPTEAEPTEPGPTETTRPESERTDSEPTESGLAEEAVEAAREAVEGGDPADQLTLRIEPSDIEVDDGIAPATAIIRTDGKLYIEGAFRSDIEAERFLDAASEVFGEEALVPRFEINPAAPDPTVSDVVLEKPVLFTSGSAEIDPEYVPFLEACAGVLKANPGIVMSISAFTDATGDAELNLELSQRRADAIVAFYRSMDIADDQLISIGFGESDFVADNDSEDGRKQNRRAMLELLNVMNEGSGDQG